MNKDQLLHDYIITHSAELTEKWLKLRRKLRGRFYSADQLSEEMKRLLIEQHTFTNTVIASAFLEDPAVFQHNKEKWAAQVAKSRVEQDAEVHEVVEAIGNSRTVFWEAVTRFMDEHQDIVTNEDARRWNYLVNGSFDQLMTDFTEQFQKLMIARLSSQQELISELSCPVILIADTIGTLPLIGAIDTRRARVILERVPENLSIRWWRSNYICCRKRYFSSASEPCFPAFGLMWHRLLSNWDLIFQSIKLTALWSRRSPAWVSHVLSRKQKHRKKVLRPEAGRFFCQRKTI